MGLNPLREVLQNCIDFDRLRAADAPRLFIATTQANTGRLRLFENAELSVDVLLASACLPTLQAAVLIDGQPRLRLQRQFPARSTVHRRARGGRSAGWSSAWPGCAPT